MEDKEYKTYDDLPVFISPKELSKIMGLHITTIYDLIQNEDFPNIRIGTRYVIPKEDFLRWINTHKKPDKC